MTERSQLIEIDIGSSLWTMTFSENGEHLVIGDENRVGVWRAEDAKQVATMKTVWTVNCLAVSQDGKWISAGTYQGEVFVWTAKTYRRVFQGRKDGSQVYAVDFSPDATRLVAGCSNRTATVLDLVTRKQIQTLRHANAVIAAKYSPQGDRIATATPYDIRVWNNSNGHLLLVTPVKVTPWYNTGLLWSNNHIFAVSDKTIKELNTSRGSIVSEWPVPITDGYSCIVLPKHGGFIAYASDCAVTFFDTTTHSPLAQIQHPQDIRSIALSEDDEFIALGGKKGKITIAGLSRITDLIPLSRLHPTFQEPDIHIDDAALDSWKHDQLENAEALLTAAITTSQNQSHHLLASRALVRARLRKWDTALTDAGVANNIQPSVIGYIAKSIAHVGGGDRHKGYETCDIAFELFRSSHGAFLLLIKAIIVFMAGEHVDAISRLEFLIATAYMYLLHGNLHMKSRKYEDAIQSFEHAQAQLQLYRGQPLFVVSLISGWKFDDLGTTIRQRLCEGLYSAGRTKEAVECLHKMTTEFGEEMSLCREYRKWAVGFSGKLEHFGDTSLDTERYNEAISHYSSALSLDTSSLQRILIKRSMAFVAIRSWQQALDDANRVIELDPSSPWGYEMKHAALHSGGDYGNAVNALDEMWSKTADSPDPDVRRRRDQYINPSSTRARIRKTVQRTIRRLPRELINTINGCLYNRAEQASAFESSPIFNELVSSMTTRIDRARIKYEVRRFFQYVMLSHKWEENEPLYQQVMQVTVYNLDKSPTHDKLQTFCKIVRDAGFEWACSDTCCINKSDSFILQEALVAMFGWYHGSAMVIVFLRGVCSSSKLGALVRSIWNTRAWTLQEYVAAKVVHFYTEDWTLYLDLKLPNHKLSPEVISEMEQATGVPADQLMALRPGLTNIREKLRLASTRQTTLMEDTAYSLLGIFSAAGISPIYGEGEASLGRLLANVLTRSGDVSVLAWTGESGPFNSCLPARIGVYNGPATSHLSPQIPDAEMERIVTMLDTPSFDLDAALRLYDRLNEFPSARFAESRMSLPCIAFPLLRLSSRRTTSGRVHLANTDAFGTVEIRTRRDLSRVTSLYLVYPWLGTLLEHEDVQSSESEEDDEESSDEEINDEVTSEIEIDDSSLLPEPESPSHSVSVRAVPMDKETCARRLVARLRQPFGALLFRVAATDQHVVAYKRVAPDSVINVQFRENFPLSRILDRVCTVDVL